MSIHIIVDSASDFTQAQAKELGIEVLPLTTRFGDVEYRDGVDLTHDQFFEKLIETDTLPQTSQLTPYQYSEAFAQLGENDTAVVVTLSSKLSGCYQSACIAAQSFEERIFVVDSENVTIGEQLLVQRALELRTAGRSAGEIAEILEKEKKEIRVIALLDTLEYLQKGGRISTTTAWIGGMLSIKPVISIHEGAILAMGKARGSKNGNNLLTNYVRESGGIDFTKPFALAYSGLSDVLINKYISDSAKLYEGYSGELPIARIGSTIGTHVGPGAIALAFFHK